MSKRVCRVIGALAFSAALLVGCGGGDDAPPLVFPSNTELLPVSSRYVEGALQSTQISTQRFVAIRDQAAWSAFWAEYNEGVSPTPPLPVVDFSAEMVLGFVYGGAHYRCATGSSGGVPVQSRTLTIFYYGQTYDKSPTSCEHPTWNPSVLKVLPRSDAPVQWIEQPLGKG